jgi:hypothetical protein
MRRYSKRLFVARRSRINFFWGSFRFSGKWRNGETFMRFGGPPKAEPSDFAWIPFQSRLLRRFSWFSKLFHWFAWCEVAQSPDRFDLTVSLRPLSLPLRLCVNDLFSFSIRHCRPCISSFLDGDFPLPMEFQKLRLTAVTSVWNFMFFAVFISLWYPSHCPSHEIGYAALRSVMRMERMSPHPS